MSLLMMKKNASSNSVSANVDEALFTEPQETALHASISTYSQQAAPLFESGDYTDYLRMLARLREPVDNFFDAVMVMADDESIRNNRLALLAELSRLFGKVADISRLSAS